MRGYHTFIATVLGQTLPPEGKPKPVDAPVIELAPKDARPEYFQAPAPPKPRRKQPKTAPDAA